MTTPWITPPSAQTLSGDEPIIGTASSVRDFWAWGMSNLRTNTLRSMLAEYLVACAVAVQRTQRIEWDAFDLQIPEGRIEVKSSAYLQAWDQPRNSRIVFSGLRARTWDPRTQLSELADYNADVYVFAVQAASTHDRYDALDTTQWQFWVLPRAVGRHAKWGTLSPNYLSP